jgi:hypothetical protein
VKYNTIPPGDPLVALSKVAVPLKPAVRLLPDRVMAATLPWKSNTPAALNVLLKSPPEPVPSANPIQPVPPPVAVIVTPP